MPRTILFAAILVTIMIPRAAYPTDPLVERFSVPEPEYSPVPIWWWSGDPLEPEKLGYQLERLAEGGIHHAIILNLAPSGPLYGSAADEPPFLTEQWWELFAHALEAGKKAGVRLWFYDQLGFSGSGLQARVVRDHPEFRGVDLRRKVRDVDGPAEVTLSTPPGGTALAAFTAECVNAGEEVVAWIWDGGAIGEQCQRYFRRTFELDEPPRRAELRITCNDAFMVFINGVKVGDDFDEIGRGFRSAEKYDVSQHLRAGKNVIAVKGENLGGPAFLLLKLWAGMADPDQPLHTLLISDAQFKVSAKAPNGWQTLDFNDSDWGPVYSIPERIAQAWQPIAGLELGAGRAIRKVRARTSQIEDGRLRVTVPAGLHSVQLYYTEAGGFDYQNRRAGEALLNIVHHEFERRFGSELGKSIAGSFQDEFPALPRFSQLLPEEFRQRMGYDLLARLPALYDDVVDRFGDPQGPTSTQIRCAANDVAAQLCEEAFFIPLHEWHEKYGLLCGYDQTVRNADPIRGEAYYVDYFKTMRHYSVPGCDQDGDPKVHQSIADLYARPRVWIESFHSSGWGQTLEEINTLLNPWLVNGATLFNPHAVYYSVHGSYWEWAPPDTGWRQPHFVHHKVFADHISRLTSILSRGRHVVHTAVLHPASTIHGDSGYGNGGIDASDANKAYWRVQDVLRENGMDYIVIDEDSIDRASIEEGHLHINDLALRRLILPAAKTLRGSTLEKLSLFLEKEGDVIIVGKPPEHVADRSLAPSRLNELLAILERDADRVADSSSLVDRVPRTVPRNPQENLPVLHRKLGTRDFFFLLSDPKTKTNGNARFEINQRELWQTAAARAVRMPFTLAADGIPEKWNTLTGAVEPIHNYRRDKGTTRVDVELTDTPAPLIAIRPAQASEPLAVESTYHVLNWSKSDSKDEIVVRALQPIPAADDSARSESVRMEFEHAVYEGAADMEPASVIDIPGPVASRLLPTCDNKYGDFAWPPTDGPIPVEVRGLRYQAETEGTGVDAWMNADFDDRNWPLAIASFGPRAEWIGPLSIPSGESFKSLKTPPCIAGAMHPAIYSLRLGLNEDPVFHSALGGKGRIPEEFIDLGTAQAGAVYLVRTDVVVNTDSPLDALLRAGGSSRRRIFLNGQEVQFGEEEASRKVRAMVRLQPGINRLEALLSRETNGNIRFFYHFLPPEGIPEDPEWIWNRQTSPSGKCLFTRTLDISGPIESAAMVVALGDLHRIRINGKLLADQGNFDPYFTSRAEQYDITAFVQPGENRIEIEARDLNTPTGLLLDGLIVLKDGREISFVSGSSFLVRNVEETSGPLKPARILNAPATAYMGDPALMLLQPRPHPLPLGGWLVGQAPPAAPFDSVIPCRGTGKPLPGWYRFRIPPGATALSLKTPGKPELYLNGKRLALTPSDSTYRANLPNPDDPKRIAALRIESIPGFEEGAAILEPIRFEVGPGRIPFGSWDKLGLPHYSGGLIYETEVEIPTFGAKQQVLDLGRVRGTAEIVVNGKSCGVRLWHPYRFDITEALQRGPNKIQMHVYNTLGPHFDIGHPGGHVYENHTISGVLGPVKIFGVQELKIRLTKIQ